LILFSKRIKRDYKKIVPRLNPLPSLVFGGRMK